MRSFLNQIKQMASRLGNCEPLWLKNGETPEFKTVEGIGSGKEIVLLHGLLGALSNWDSVYPLLGNFAKPIALHFPILTGHRSEVRVNALAAYTELFLRTRNLNPVTLCGNSLGGHVAMRLYLASPAMVDCLILSGTSGLYEHTVDALPVRPDRRFIRDQMVRVFANERFITEEAIEQVFKIVSDRNNVLNIIHSARSAKKDNLLSVLKEIKVPTLLLWGEEDQVTTMDVAETFHREIPNATLITKKNCGHAPMIEHPEWFAEEVKRFLQKLGKIPA